ncbi:PAS domain-containing sensor histidine kinase [Pontibacter litorisediminis]|uniref:PAS domain-containing sensor histidine kinase n=1 Tax=Pontibacter litorisediminis TaxID=1846260 RepID=UPI0023EAAD4A|nr:PAS domain-containing sensor histidine kinase [Pontibacter litorisediminis]
MQPPVLQEATQSHSREFYRALVGNSIDLVSVLDAEGTYTFVGDSVTGVLGYTPDELLGVNVMTLVHPEDLASIQAALEELLNLKNVVVPPFRFRHKDGEWHWLECSCKNMLHDEHVRGILTSSRDITAAVQLAYDHDYHQAYYRSLFFQHPDTVFTLDLNGEFKKVNRHVQELTGYTSQELLGQPYTRMLHPDSLKIADRAMKKVWSGKAHTEEVCMVNKAGETRNVSVSVMPVYFRGEILGAQGIAKDITEAVKSQKLVIKLADDLYKHNLDLQQFTYMISHNLRAPVANALGLVQLVRKLPKDTANYDAAVEKLHTSVEQLDTVVKDISQVLSLRESGRISERETVYLSKVCQQVLEQFQGETELKAAQVKVEIDPSFRLQSISSHLYSILYNLVSNSLKYKSSYRQLELTIRAERDNRGYVLTVSDNGSGMDMHLVQHQLFQLYKRFHPNTYGKGIGLFLVKTQVQALGGKIEVESAPDQGTTFKIYLGARHV